MKKDPNLLAGALCLAAIALFMPADGAQALDQDQRIVTKVHITCEEGDCEEHQGDRRFQFTLGDHMGGGFLGIGLTELTPELRAHFGVGEDEGVMISKVLEDSPAQRAGLQAGDILTAVDGERIRSGRGLTHTIRAKEDGEAVLLEVWRDGSVQSLTAALEERESAPHGMGHAFVFDCEGEECGSSGHFAHGPLAIDCDGEPCVVEVDCDGDECVCTVDGEETDCGVLHHRRKH